MRAVYHPEFKASFEAVLKHCEDIGRPLPGPFLLLSLRMKLDTAISPRARWMFNKVALMHGPGCLFDRCGETGQLAALGECLKAGDGRGGNFNDLALFARGFAPSTGTCPAMREFCPAEVEIIDHVFSGIEAGFEVGCVGLIFLQGFHRKCVSHWRGRHER